MSVPACSIQRIARYGGKECTDLQQYNHYLSTHPTSAGFQGPRYRVVHTNYYSSQPGHILITTFRTLPSLDSDTLLRGPGKPLLDMVGSLKVHEAQVFRLRANNLRIQQTTSPIVFKSQASISPRWLLISSQRSLPSAAPSKLANYCTFHRETYNRHTDQKDRHLSYFLKILGSSAHLVSRKQAPDPRVHPFSTRHQNPASNLWADTAYASKSPDRSLTAILPL
jgi:hypothetical protein